MVGLVTEEGLGNFIFIGFMAHLCIRLRSYLLNLKGGAEHYFPNIFNRGLIYTGRGFQKIEPLTKVLLKTIRAKKYL